MQHYPDEIDLCKDIYALAGICHVCRDKEDPKNAIDMVP